MTAAWYWLVLAVMAAAGVAAGEPPQAPAASAASAAPATGTSAPSGEVAKPVGKPAGNAGADEDFMEFLGADDVGAAEWELLKKTAPAKVQRPMPPTQDATS